MDGERFRIISELTSDLAYDIRIEPDGSITTEWVSDAAEHITGFTAREIVSQGFQSIIHPADRLIGRQHIKNTLSGQTDVSEIRLVTKTGEVRWLRNYARPIWDESQTRVVRIYGAARDITEQKLAQEELRRKERELTDFIENAAVAVQEVGQDGTILWANQAELNMLGYTREEYVGRNIAEFHVDQGRIKDILHRLSNKETLRDYEARLRAKDGSIRSVVISSNVLRENDQFVHTRCFTRDITEMKQAEEARAILASIVESSDDAILSKDMDGIILSWNRGAERLYGYSAAEVVGRPVSIIVPPNKADDFPNIMERLRRGEKIDHYETERMRKDGQRLYVSLTASPIIDASGNITGASAIARDITESKRSEQALADRLHEIEAMMEVLPVGLFITYDRESTRIVGNRAAREFLRMGRDAEANLSLTAPPDEVPVNFKVFKNGREIPPEELPVQRAAAKGISVRNFEAEVVFSDGEVRHELLSAVPLFDQKGIPRGAVASLMDITDRKRFEQALRESEERLRMALSASRTVAWSWDLRTDAVTYSENSGEVLGLLSDQHVSRSWDSVHPEDLKSLSETIKRAIAERGEYRTDFRINFQNNGNVACLHTRGKVECDPSGQPVRIIGTSTDISEQKRIEQEREQLLAREQAARAQAEAANCAKDEFLATLSHELRTPLNAIMGWAELLRQKKLAPSLVEHAVDVISRNTKLQAQLVEDILDMSRIITGKFELDVRRVELLPVVQAGIDVIRPAAEAKEINLEKEFDASVYDVVADPTRLQQILWNLLSNAVKFTPKGGSVKVAVRRADSDAEISITDTGQGISADFLPYIFDRFSQADSSSTRRHMGLGLGLALARHLVEMHGGTIAAYSAGEGQGSVFKVRLSLAAAEAGSGHLEQAFENSQKLANTSPVLDGLRVLLVDDHADTREMLYMVLQVYGAEVRTSESASEAFAALQEWKPDLLISDIGMPEEDGYSLIHRIRSLPTEQGGATPAIALTGYASADEGEQARRAGFEMYLAKPIDSNNLIDSIVTLHNIGTKEKRV